MLHSETLDYGIEADWWALGTNLYELRTDRIPFEASHIKGNLQEQILHYIVNKNIDFYTDKLVCDTKLAAILSKLVVKEPTERLSWSSEFDPVKTENYRVAAFLCRMKLVKNL